MNFTLEINLGKETLDMLKQLLNKTTEKPVKEKIVKEEKTAPDTQKNVIKEENGKLIPITETEAKQIIADSTPTKMTEAEVRAIVGPINKDADMDTKRKIKEEYLGGLALPEFVRTKSASEIVDFVEQVKALKK